jgi:hypothetical protein
MNCEHDQAGADAARTDYAKWVAAVLCEKFKYSVETLASGKTWINTGPEAVDVTELAELLATEADYRVRLWRES